MIKNFIFDGRINGKLENLKVGLILTATDGKEYKILSDQPFYAGSNEDGSIQELELEVLEIKSDITLDTEIIDNRDFSKIDSLLW